LSMAKAATEREPQNLVFGIGEQVGEEWWKLS